MFFCTVMLAVQIPSDERTNAKCPEFTHGFSIHNSVQKIYIPNTNTAKQTVRRNHQGCILADFRMKWDW